MANKITATAITATAWTKIVDNKTSCYLIRNVNGNYRIRVLATGDAAPTSAIEVTDIDPFLLASRETFSVAAAADIYCRMTDGSGSVSVLI